MLAITTQIFDYDVTQESDTERRKFYYLQEINFFTAVTLRRPTTFELGGKELVEFEHQVDVNYFLEADTTGNNFNRVIDRLVTLESLVISALGGTWAGTVDFYRLTSVFAPIEVIIDGRQVWNGRNVYTANERTQYI